MKLPHRLRLLSLVAVEVLVIVGLHALGRREGFAVGWSDIAGWLEDTPFEDAAGAVLLLLALVLAYWLLISTVSYAVASRSGSTAAIRAVGWLTLPPIRRLVSRAVALSIAASAMASPLAPAIANLTGGDDAGRVIVEVDAEGRLRPPGTQSPEDAGTVLPPHLGAQEPAEAPETTVLEPMDLVDGSVSHTVTVQRGDHLWSLSERHLERALGRNDLGEHEIARYWVRVIDLNRATIRSGDPDLIYPGERIVLPPLGT